MTRPPVNGVCPVCGMPVDDAAPTILGRPLRSSEPEVVAIGACSTRCAAIIARHPEAYADAALDDEVVSGLSS